MIICREKNGRKIYFCPSKTRKDRYHRIVFLTSEWRYLCECEFKVYRKLGKHDKCSHIRRLEDYLDNKPEMIEYDFTKEVDDLDV